MLKQSAYFMDIQKLLASAKTQTFDKFGQKLNSLVRENYRFSNLDESNRKVVLEIIKRHLSNIHSGYGISLTIRQREMYKLFQNRLKLKLTEQDLADIKEILELFKK